MVLVLNRCTIMGRLVREPELRAARSGIAVVSFTLAVERDFKDRQTGERTVDFIDVVAWRGTAEFVARFFTKGRMAVVEGRLQMRDWTDREGGRRRSAEVVADSVYFGGSRGGGGAPSAPAAGHEASAGGPAALRELSDDDDGELPF